MTAPAQTPSQDELFAALAPNEAGLVAAIVIAADDGRVLMLGYMNREALSVTLERKQVTFFSRSKGRLWTKGESSGHVLRLVDIRIDCDGDALLVRAHPVGPTCHTGESSCFFRGYRLDARTLEDKAVLATPVATPLQMLQRVIESRRDTAPATGEKPSYVRSLLTKGADAIGAKITEEAQELVDAIRGESDERVISEAADLLFHAMVGLASRGLDIERVANVLGARHGVGGLTERAQRAAGPRVD